MTTHSRRRRLMLLATALTPFAVRAQAGLPEVTVYKSDACGCCKDWIRHLEASGFKTKAINVADSRIWRARLGMPGKYGSCHTALVGGYVVEGHVPAADIKRLLREQPLALGLAAPGMPIGSPGMDGPEYKGQVDRYDVLLVEKNGGARVWASYG